MITRGRTVSSNKGFDAFPPALPQSVYHEEQQGEDEEGRDAADDEPHATGHRVKQTAAVWNKQHQTTTWATETMCSSNRPTNGKIFGHKAQHCEFRAKTWKVLV